MLFFFDVLCVPLLCCIAASELSVSFMLSCLCYWFLFLWCWFYCCVCFVQCVFFMFSLCYRYVTLRCSSDGVIVSFCFYLFRSHVGSRHVGSSCCDWTVAVFGPNRRTRVLFKSSAYFGAGVSLAPRQGELGQNNPPWRCFPLGFRQWQWVWVWGCRRGWRCWQCWLCLDGQGCRSSF